MFHDDARHAQFPRYAMLMMIFFDTAFAAPPPPLRFDFSIFATAFMMPSADVFGYCFRLMAIQARRDIADDERLFLRGALPRHIFAMPLSRYDAIFAMIAASADFIMS